MVLEDKTGLPILGTFLVIAAVSLIFYKLAIDTGLEKIDPAAIKVNEKIRLKESEE